MCHAVRRPLLPCPTRLALLSLPPHPRDELRALQHGLCAGCGRPLKTRSYFARDSGGLRIAALICMGCAQSRRPVADPPVLHAPPLLRLRLTHGTPASTPRGDAGRLAAAFAAGDWDRFASPLHALLVAQGGRCALWRPGKPAREQCSAGGEHQLLYLDHDHSTGLARALLCPPCNSREGWGAGSPAQRAAAARLRDDPPAGRCPATRGLSHYWLTGWARPAGWRPEGPPRLPSRTRPRPPRRCSEPGLAPLAATGSSR